ncbi:hypothetical protein ACTXT7_010981 [Hymenolepis weldensis]
MPLFISLTLFNYIPKHPNAAVLEIQFKNASWTTKNKPRLSKHTWPSKNQKENNSVFLKLKVQSYILSSQISYDGLIAFAFVKIMKLPEMECLKWLEFTILFSRQPPTISIG